MGKAEAILEIQIIKNKYGEKTARGIAMEISWEIEIAESEKEEDFKEITLMKNSEDYSLFKKYRHCFFIFCQFPNYDLINSYLDEKDGFVLDKKIIEYIDKRDGWTNKKLLKEETLQNCLEIAKLFYQRNSIYIDDYRIIRKLYDYLTNRDFGGSYMSIEQRRKIKEEKKLWRDEFLKECKKYYERRYSLLEFLNQHTYHSDEFNEFFFFSRTDDMDEEEREEYCFSEDDFIEGLDNFKTQRKGMPSLSILPWEKYLWGLRFWKIKELENIKDNPPLPGDTKKVKILTGKGENKKYERKEYPAINIVIADKILKGYKEMVKEFYKAHCYIKLYHKPTGQEKEIAFNQLISDLKTLLNKTRNYDDILLVLMFYMPADTLKKLVKSFNPSQVKDLLTLIGKSVPYRPSIYYKPDSLADKAEILFTCMDSLRQRVKTYEKMDKKKSLKGY